MRLIITVVIYSEELQIRIQIHDDDSLQDELGITQMVCMMVAPLQSPLIESARHAARFVSQIPCTSTQGSVGNSTSEQWTSLHGFLVANSGVRVQS